MKKILTTLVIMLGVYSLAQAQNGKTEFGVGIGYNSSYVSAGNSYQNTDAIGGFNVAVSVDHYFSDAWSVKIKPTYDQKGWANGFLDLGTKQIDNVDFKLTYITVPITANWHFGRTRNWYLDFGPYVGFLTSATESYTGSDMKSSFSSTDGGLALGIGVKIPVSDKLKLYFEYDGQGGVVNVFQSGSTVLNTRGAINVGINF
ncbi:MAG: porin family protein [Bacteroidota bacterium]